MHVICYATFDGSEAISALESGIVHCCGDLDIAHAHIIIYNVRTMLVRACSTYIAYSCLRTTSIQFQ